MKIVNLSLRSLVFTLVFACCLPAFAAPVSLAPTQGILQIGTNLFRARISEERFQFFSTPQTAGRQRQSNWCWAASLQMLLNYFGIPISQEEVVQFSFGVVIDSPGNSQNILKVLNSWFATFDLQIVKPRAILLNPSQELALLQLISHGYPALGAVAAKYPGNPGHAYVITGVEFSLDENGLPNLQSLILADPWPDNPSETTMSWAEFTRRQVGIFAIF